MENVTLSLVLPCYNEAGNLPRLLEAYDRVIARDDIEVIVVNNGSSDETESILREAKEKYSFLKTVHVVENQGYGFGILSGLEAAQGKYIGWSHGDLQTSPEDVVRALEIIEQHPTKNILAKGRRMTRPLIDEFFTWGMGIFESVLFGYSMFDINAQPNIFPATFFKTWHNPPHDFSLDLYCLYMAKKSGMEVVRFPVEFKKRGAGTSTWNTGLKSRIKFIKRTIDFSFKLRLKL